jgi:hypothetical protein
MKSEIRSVRTKWRAYGKETDQTRPQESSSQDGRIAEELGEMYMYD